MRNFLNQKKFVSIVIFFAALFILVATSSFSAPVVNAQGVPVKCESPKVPDGKGNCIDPANPDDTATPGKVTNTNKGKSFADYIAQGFGIFLNTTLLLSIGPMILGAAAAILSVAGILFNQAIKFSVVDMAGYINNLEAIDVGWALFRDMINMGLIFILLYISIRTILGIGSFNTQKTISSVIIVALFINFSLFATRLIIDVSNVLAVGMYDNIVKSQNINSVSDNKIEAQTPEEKAKSTFSLINIGLSGAIMKPLLLTAAFNTNADPASPSIGGALWNNSKGVAKNFIGDPWKIFITAIMGTVMMIVTAFVFFAVAFMFLTRFVVLIFVMVASPLAFGSLAFPGMEKQFNIWLDYLLKYSFFAPIYLFLIYFVAYFLNNSNIIKTNDNWSIIINFVIAIIMMLTALLAANKFGVAGSKLATKWAGAATFGLAGWVGRSSAGRLGHTLAESKTVRDLQASDSLFKRTAGSALKFSGDYASKASFDLRASALKNAPGGFGSSLGSAQGSGGYKKRLDEAKKPIIERGKFVGGLSPAEKELKEKLELQRKAAGENLEAFKTSDVEFLRFKAEIETLQKKRKEAESEVYLNEGEKEAALKALDKDIEDKTKKQSDYLKRSSAAADAEDVDKRLVEAADAGKKRREAMGQRLANKPSFWSRVMTGTAKVEAEAGEELAAKDFDEKQKKKKEEENVLKQIREQIEKDKKADSAPASAPTGAPKP